MALLHALVSALNNRLEFGNDWHDLAYVTSRLIASAEPNKDPDTHYYRTSVPDFERLLLSRHGKNWHVWNLQEDSELSYDPCTFASEAMDETTVTRLPIRDHCPAPFHKLIKTVKDIQAYLRQSKENVAVVHCKCGKGRTGLIVSTYLIAEHGDTDVEANREFTRKRIRFSIVSGVSVNSQLRYLRYANKFFKSGGNADLLDQGPVSIVAVSIRYPQCKDFRFSIAALDPTNVLPAVQDWTVKTRNDYLVVMTPAGSRVMLPADLVCEFTGVYRTVNAIPVRFSFNTIFESQCAQSESFDQGAMTLLSTPPPYGPRAITSSDLDAGIHSFRCDWEMVDGLYGTPLLGPRRFDTIEIFWRSQQGGEVFEIPRS